MVKNNLKCREVSKITIPLYEIDVVEMLSNHLNFDAV